MYTVLIFLFVTAVSCPPLETESCKERVIKPIHYIPDGMDDFLGICPTNCSDPLEPHLTVNQWSNETLLVCSPKKQIIVFCVEFNTGSNLLQPHSLCKHSDCTKHPIYPCPFKYNSTESFRFRRCFTGCGGIKSSKDIYEEQQNTNRELEEKENETELLKIKEKSYEKEIQKLNQRIKKAGDQNAENEKYWIIMIIFIITSSVLFVLLVISGVAFRCKDLHRRPISLSKDKCVNVPEQSDDDCDMSEIGVMLRDSPNDGFIDQETNEGNAEHGGEFSGSNSDGNNRSRGGTIQVDVHEEAENKQENITLNEIDNSLINTVETYTNSGV